MENRQNITKEIHSEISKAYNIQNYESVLSDEILNSQFTVGLFLFKVNGNSKQENKP